MGRARVFFFPVLLSFALPHFIGQTQAVAAVRAHPTKKKPAKPTAKKKPAQVKLRPVEQVAEPQRQTATAPPPTRGPTRIDFDDRLVQGQTNRSGAVYLYDRKELKNRSMVKKRESFRDEIVGSVYGS